MVWSHGDSFQKTASIIVAASSAVRNPIPMPSPVSGATIAALSPMFHTSAVTGATMLLYVKLVAAHEAPTCWALCSRVRR
jgi:hypothetical protein